MPENSRCDLKIKTKTDLLENDLIKNKDDELLYTQLLLYGLVKRVRLQKARLEPIEMWELEKMEVIQLVDRVSNERGSVQTKEKQNSFEYNRGSSNR